MKNKIRTFASMLTLIFIVLKLTSVISWSWWYVLMPVLLYMGIIPITVISGILFFIMLAICTGMFNYKIKI